MEMKVADGLGSPLHMATPQLALGWGAFCRGRRPGDSGSRQAPLELEVPTTSCGTHISNGAMVKRGKQAACAHLDAHKVQR